MSATVSGKISRTLRRKLRQHRVNVSATIRRALEAEVTRHERDQLQQKFARLRPLQGRVGKEEIVRLIREAREAR